MKHSQKCLDLQKEYSERINAFDALYPKCCKACGGRGEIAYYERYDEHGGEWLADVCGCVLNGKCPLCGEHVEDEENPICKNCGWTYSSTVVRPPEFDYPCECEIEIESKLENEFFPDWY